jgi:hypothetical protein
MWVFALISEHNQNVYTRYSRVTTQDLALPTSALITDIRENQPVAAMSDNTADVIEADC